MREQFNSMKNMLEDEEVAKLQNGLKKLEDLKEDFDLLSKQKPWAL
jgi:uncharacterized protein YbaP (TraB family)